MQVPFIIDDGYDHCILGLRGMKALNISLSFTAAPSSKTDGMIKQLISKCLSCKGGMKVKPVVIEVSANPIFLKRRLLTYGL